MPLPASGQISFSQINTELGLAATTTISLNQANVRALFGVASGSISASHGHGKSNRPTFNLSIGANTANYNLRNAAIAAGWNGSTAATINLTIGGVYVYSNSTGSYAFDTGTFPAGSVVTIVNNGVIVGKGGTGGSPAGGIAAGYPGGAGGPAFLAQSAVTVHNNNIIAGGGGGGGGNGSGRGMWAVAGGGGAGLGSAGTASGWSQNFPGTAGTLTAGGAGGSYLGTYGNSGGGYGSAGGPVTQSNGVPYANSGGGAAGGAVAGNGWITWANAGTRYGAIG